MRHLASVVGFSDSVILLEQFTAIFAADEFARMRALAVGIYLAKGAHSFFKIQQFCADPFVLITLTFLSLSSNDFTGNKTKRLIFLLRRLEIPCHEELLNIKGNPVSKQNTPAFAQKSPSIAEEALK